MVAGLFGDSKKTKRLKLDDFLLSFKQVKEKTQEELDKIGARTALWFHRIFGGELNPVVYEILGEEANEDKDKAA